MYSIDSQASTEEACQPVKILMKRQGCPRSIHTNSRPPKSANSADSSAMRPIFSNWCMPNTYTSVDIRKEPADRPMQ